MTCPHPLIQLDYTPFVSDDANVIRLEIRAQCSMCGPLRFLGVAEGISLCRPCLSADGLSLSLPAIPQFEEVEHERRMDA